jgi:TolA-binding protein
MRQTKADPQQAYDIYQEYLHLTGKPSLSADLYLYICTICAASGNLEDAKRILTSLLKRKADLSGLPAALVKLADAYRRKGKQDAWKKCMQVLFARYPDSSEAQMARKSLNQ